MTIQWHDLDRVAPLSGLYTKAALRRKVSGKQLPDRGLRAWLAVDNQRLADYREVCGLGGGSLLPLTYPHVMAFALQMQLLTDHDFPFPLLGLVHLSNRIRVLRPLGGLSRIHASVHVENLQPHEKGATFSLVTRIEDTLGPLWEEDSVMLCKGVHLDGAVATEVQAGAAPMIEQARWYAGSDCGRKYAKVSGDYNPIHLSAVSARLFGFPAAIAHGMFSLARALAALREQLPAANIEVQVQFRKPVRLPSEVVLWASAGGSSGQFELKGKGELSHMAGQWSPVA
ncbi:MaoC/PaaZ C-terminal domain-containing protein [Pseudomonas sp. RIT-To-2]|uniref:MaoC/PaaZ C-terminal domain-containing protein n=1 Tax=Pseudomonas sp. RIT-To-2 TaxID=3462541 RepID=UPI0024130E6F